jgi:hypothetical protein
MRWTGRMAVAALMMMSASTQAHAADWWWVAGEPGGSTAIFIDADTVVKHDDAVSFRTQRIQRDGRATEINGQMRCNTPSASTEEEAMRRFACATPEERMSFALIVAPMTPGETARLIFAMPRQTSEGPGKPRVAGD